MIIDMTLLILLRRYLTVISSYSAIQSPSREFCSHCGCFGLCVHIIIRNASLAYLKSACTRAQVERRRRLPLATAARNPLINLSELHRTRRVASRRRRGASQRNACYYSLKYFNVVRSFNQYLAISFKGS